MYWAEFTVGDSSTHTTVGSVAYPWLLSHLCSATPVEVRLDDVNIADLLILPDQTVIPPADRGGLSNFE